MVFQLIRLLLADAHTNGRADSRSNGIISEGALLPAMPIRRARLPTSDEIVRGVLGVCSGYHHGRRNDVQHLYRRRGGAIQHQCLWRPCRQCRHDRRRA